MTCLNAKASESGDDISSDEDEEDLVTGGDGGSATTIRHTYTLDIASLFIIYWGGGVRAC